MKEESNDGSTIAPLYNVDVRFILDKDESGSRSSLLNTVASCGIFSCGHFAHIETKRREGFTHIEIKEVQEGQRPILAMLEQKIIFADSRHLRAPPWAARALELH